VDFITTSCPVHKMGVSRETDDTSRRLNTIPVPGSQEAAGHPADSYLRSLVWSLLNEGVKSGHDPVGQVVATIRLRIDMPTIVRHQEQCALPGDAA